MPYMKHYLAFLLLAFCLSCTAQKKEKTDPDQAAEQLALPLRPQTPIADFVVEVFADSKGNLWFGTMSKGVARYDGKSLYYFTTNDGLSGNTVASIIEDDEGNIWFGTHSGLSRYDGFVFKNYTRADGLCHDRVSNLLIDKTGNFWVGTWGGVCRFESGEFSAFELPIPDVELAPYQTTHDWVTEITEDTHGNIWFGRDGYGACKYDGESYVHFTEDNGLPSNNVQAIYPDSAGSIWFGTRVAERDAPDPSDREGNGGLSRLVGNTITNFTQPGLSENDIYTVTGDSHGNLWISAIGHGVYRYDGTAFKLYSDTDRPDLIQGFGLQGFAEDINGEIWLGFSGGLFRIVDGQLVHIGKEGPWR